MDVSIPWNNIHLLAFTLFRSVNVSFCGHEGKKVHAFNILLTIL